MPRHQKTFLSFGGSTWADFVRGLTEPSVFSVTTALATMSVIFLLCCLIFNANFAASERYRYLMADGYDTQTYVTHKILTRASQPGPAIVVLGTSVTIRCIESEAALSALVEDASGTHLPTYDFATDAQSIWEMVAITARRPPGPDGILVIGLSPGLLAMDADGPGRSALTTVLRSPQTRFLVPRYRRRSTISRVSPTYAHRHLCCR